MIFNELHNAMICVHLVVTPFEVIFLGWVAVNEKVFVFGVGIPTLTYVIVHSRMPEKISIILFVKETSGAYESLPNSMSLSLVRV